MSKQKKVIVILGPTSSGKTGLGVKLAYKFNGEIISADSRQVYRGMDIGTGKDLDEYKIKLKVKSNLPAGKAGKLKVINIPYHLIDVVSPRTRFNLAKYQKLAFKAIDDILSCGKLPIIVGGTGLYLQAVVDNYKLSSAKPDKKLREELEKMDVDKLFIKLQKLNPKFASKLHQSDKKNKRRLIRYMEIANQCAYNRESMRINNKYDFLLIGLTWPKEVLHKRIYNRLIERLEKENMIDEIKRLHKQGVSWKRLKGFGLEYKYISMYLQKELSYKEMVERLNIAIRQFSKRQMSWLRRWEKQGAKIFWVKSEGEAGKLVKRFIK